MRLHLLCYATKCIKTLQIYEPYSLSWIIIHGCQKEIQIFQAWINCFLVFFQENLVFFRLLLVFHQVFFRQMVISTCFWTFSCYDDFLECFSSLLSFSIHILYIYVIKVLTTNGALIFFRVWETQKHLKAGMKFCTSFGGHI